MKVSAWNPRFGKRACDLALAGMALALLLPLALIVAAAIHISMGPPVLFRQVRTGLHGKPFVMYKFRTMRELQDARGAYLPDELRLTTVGRLIRRLSLDEIPELWNVLKGDMSLVGPRPLLTEYLPLYSPDQARRHEVKPGVTGWAMIHGRNAITWEEKFRLDLWYVDNWSVWLDLRVLTLTLWKVFRREGINYAGHETMPKFKGSSE